ncbi:unnamed protein product, partial [Anisakis simplex]|uniref:glucuronosyltransferase n=1 Tax=Anisakis simplex TaxID=6269 RepID=A0A0M3J6C4_ANISI
MNGITSARVFTSRPALYSLREDDLDYDVTNCFHRLLAVFAEALAAVRVKYNIEHRNNKGLAMLGIQDFTFTNLWQNHAFNFVEEIDYLTFPSPMSTDVVYIGSHCPIAKRLPDDLREFTEDASSKGTIYIAFGTAVQWHSAPEYVTNAFRYMIENLRDYRILFVYNGNSFGELPEHVNVLKWAPQFDVLSHNKTILFISHGGLKSVKEAICTSTPVVY